MHIIVQQVGILIKCLLTASLHSLVLPVSSSRLSHRLVVAMQVLLAVCEVLLLVGALQLMR